jgi:hypothetical protein
LDAGGDNEDHYDDYDKKIEIDMHSNNKIHGSMIRFATYLKNDLTLATPN